MNDIKNEKIKRFISDKVMSEAVFEVIQEVFMRPKPNTDVNKLAASFLSLGQLQDAVKEFEKYKNQEQEKPVGVRQVGL